MTSHYSTMARDEFWDYASRARSSGKDLAEVLDREGVLLTPERRAQIRFELIVTLANTIQVTEPNLWFKPGVPATPRDLKEAIVTWLFGLAEEMKKELPHDRY